MINYNAMANGQLLNLNEITQSSDIVTSKSKVGRPRKCGKALDTDELEIVIKAS